MKKIGSSFTAVVVARNEHNRLPLVLKNFASLENVLVVDNFSTDDTREIAEKFGRPWIQVANVGGFCETDDWMQPVWAHIKTPYFLLAACAESLPIALLNKYSEIAASGSHEVVLTQRVSITAGLPIPIDLPPRWLGWHYLGEIRFFKLGAVSYTGNQVHDRGRVLVPENRVLRLGRDPELCFYQYRDYDASETEEKHRIYNDVLAAQRFAAGIKPSFFLGCVKALKRFILCYIIYGGFRFGVLGFMHCYYRFHMELGLAFRAYELSGSYSKRDLIRMHLDFRGEGVHRSGS
jgi:glycosyltransferase involved in cell wall biosynthesis